MKINFIVKIRFLIFVTSLFRHVFRLVFLTCEDSGLHYEKKKRSLNAVAGFVCIFFKFRFSARKISWRVKCIDNGLIIARLRMGWMLDWRRQLQKSAVLHI